VLHDDIDAIVAQFVLLDTQLLKSNVVLEHFSEVNCHTLANSPVYRVIDVQFLQCVVTRIEHRENTNDTIVLNLVISQVQRKHFIMGEEKLGYHHSSVSLNFIAIQVEHL
jgi:hypothetical protein